MLIYPLPLLLRMHKTTLPSNANAQKVTIANSGNNHPAGFCEAAGDSVGGGVVGVVPFPLLPYNGIANCAVALPPKSKTSKSPVCATYPELGSMVQTIKLFASAVIPHTAPLDGGIRMKTSGLRPLLRSVPTMNNVAPALTCCVV